MLESVFSDCSSIQRIFFTIYWHFFPSHSSETYLSIFYLHNHLSFPGFFSLSYLTFFFLWILEEFLYLIIYIGAILLFTGLVKSIFKVCQQGTVFPKSLFCYLRSSFQLLGILFSVIGARSSSMKIVCSQYHHLPLISELVWILCFHAGLLVVWGWFGYGITGQSRVAGNPEDKPFDQCGWADPGINIRVLGLALSEGLQATLQEGFLIQWVDYR